MLSCTARGQTSSRQRYVTGEMWHLYVWSHSHEIPFLTAILDQLSILLKRWLILGCGFDLFNQLDRTYYTEKAHSSLNALSLVDVLLDMTLVHLDQLTLVRNVVLCTECHCTNRRIGAITANDLLTVIGTKNNVSLLHTATEWPSRVFKLYQHRADILWSWLEMLECTETIGVLFIFSPLAAM